MISISGKTVLVTGGGTGAGKAIAAAFANEGANVVITGRREEKLKEAVNETNAQNSVRYYAADVSNREQVDAMMKWISEALGPVDILVSNAGTNIPQRTLDVLSPEDWDKVIKINATGHFNVVHAVLPNMRERKDGVIIAVSSIAGIRPSILGGGAYSAAKHAMTALTKMIGLEEKDNGIRATSINPGEINTPILDNRPEPPGSERRAVMLQPEDIAEAALFVAKLHPRANVLELTIKPTNAAYA